MGCWLRFRGSLTIEPAISDEDRKAFNAFSYENSFPYNPDANYANPWIINDEGRLECIGCKFGEHGMWMELLYDKFFDPKGYDVYGTLLISGEGRQLDWHVVRFDNGKELYTHHIDDVHVDLDFWEVGAKYAKKYWEEHPPECITLDTAKDNDIMQL